MQRCMFINSRNKVHDESFAFYYAYAFPVASKHCFIVISILFIQVCQSKLWYRIWEKSLQGYCIKPPFRQFTFLSVHQFYLFIFTESETNINTSVVQYFTLWRSNKLKYKLKLELNWLDNWFLTDSYYNTSML